MAGPARGYHKNIIHRSEFDRGSHYVTHVVPDLLIGDVREFFRFR